MLKLLLNHWQDSHRKTPTRVQSEDPLLCTDLAKTRPNEEFSVSRVNPLFVDSSAETSPNIRLKGAAKTIVQVHSNSRESDQERANERAPSEPPDVSSGAKDKVSNDAQKAAKLELKDAAHKEDGATTDDTAPKTLLEDQASDSGRESGSSPTSEEHSGSDELSSVASEASTTPGHSDKTAPKPLVELREWEKNRGLDNLVKPGTTSVITREKIDLIEKVIAHRLTRQFSDRTANGSILRSTNSSYLHSVRKAVVSEQATPEGPKEELPATKEKTESVPTTQTATNTKPTPQVLSSAPDQSEPQSPQALQLPTTPPEVPKDEISEVEANQEQTEVIAEIMPAVTRPDESSSSTSDSTTESKNADVASKSSSSSAGQTSVDSGITRGDQVHTDVPHLAPTKASTKSDSSDHSSDSKTRKRSAMKSKGLRNSQRRNHGVENKLRCSFCRRNAKRNQRRISKHKHRSIAAPEVVSSNGTLTDLALEHPWLSDGCPVHFHGKRSSISCMENCRDYPYEEFCNAVYRHPQGPMPLCNCDSCCYSSSGHGHSHSDCYHWEELPRSRFSWNGGGDDPTPCTCKRSHPAFSSRRKVKFAQRPATEGSDPKDGEKDGEQDSEKDDGEKDDSVDGSACPASKDIKTNGHVLMEGGMYDKNGPTVLPWHEWQLYMREKNLRARRKRALCMGVIALTIVVFVGVSVSLALAFLRKKF